ncbi:TAXI family TRAP transporter solute-binding subunit [Halorientalis marina]|jgi:TRAP transporter TAXI family solute receptor|uniref:TAXI family TRAP transporter solute-binding subunit n=1 Tax=Halorientalis marina TaxID=2931976 RepID=UPI001FF59257|nr:TAXI family TRAP transporter solute-binding subunit [Halorientalis marina]
MPRGTTRRRLLASAGAAAAVGLAGCGGGGSAIGGTDRLVLHYGDMNEQIAREIAAVVNAHGIETVLKQGGSSVENLQTVNANEGAMALIPADIVFFGKQGSGIEAIDGEKGRVRNVVPLYPLPLTVVARGDFDAEYINELDGATINTGEPGTALNTNAIQLVNPLDIEFSTANLPLSEALDRIVAGELDATVARGDWPIPGIVEAAESADLKLLSLNPTVVETAVQNEWLINEPPYGSIPASVYPGIDYVVDTLSLMTLLVVNSETPKGMVAGATAAFFDNRDQIRTHNAYLPERIQKSGEDTFLNAQLGVPVELHEGAAEVIMFS